METELVHLFFKAKEEDKDAILQIIDKFMPLVKKYSRKLLYEGAESDLVIALIKTIKVYPLYTNKLNADCTIVSYIDTSIRHEYIRLSKKNREIVANEIGLNEDIFLIQTSSDTESNLFVKELLNKLPVKQKQVLKKIFINECSEAELALQLNVSRQYINKVKRKALNNLKKYI